jgi:hypothetical protein
MGSQVPTRDRSDACHSVFQSIGACVNAICSQCGLVARIFGFHGWWQVTRCATGAVEVTKDCPGSVT